MVNDTVKDILENWKLLWQCTIVSGVTCCLYYSHCNFCVACLQANNYKRHREKEEEGEENIARP